LGLELMLLAAMINLAAFTTYLHPAGLQGHAITLLLVLAALAQLGVGLALVGMLLRRKEAPEAPAPDLPESDPLNVERYDDLKW
jgi:NADH:ubiquinone oxidoreductase subunit K